MLKWLDKIPFILLFVAAIVLGIAPGPPEPHLVEKVKMLLAGTLSKPIDIFDLVMHSLPLILLVLKSIRHVTRRKNPNDFS